MGWWGMRAEQQPPGDGEDDTAAIDAILAGGFDAALADVAAADFHHKIDAARRELQAAHTKATDVTRFDLAATVARIVAAPWGWADYLVPAVPPERHSWPAGASIPPAELIAVGLVAPGRRDIAALALSYDHIPVTTQAVAAGAGGAAGGAIIGAAAGWPGWVDAAAAAVLGGAGVFGLLTWYRSRIRNRALSYRVTADDPAAPPVIAALAVLMNLTVFLERFSREMRREATGQRMQPIDVDQHTLQVPAAIHQALWELATETTSDGGPDVLAAVQTAAAAAVADVHATWRAFDTFRPVPLPEPEPPVLPAATPAQNLLDLATELRQEQHTRQQATDDVAQINTRHIPG